MPGLISQTSLLFHFRNTLPEDIKEYRDDFKTVTYDRERRRIPFFHKSPQLAFRKQVVEYLKKYTEENNLSQCCLHLAVYLLDIFMDNHSIVPEKILLVGNVCLLLAAKFEELNTAPKISDLNAATNNTYSITDYKMIEILILKFFHWYLMFPTPAHYTYYFVQSVISPEDLKQADSSSTLLFKLYTTIKTLLDKIVDDIHYMQRFVPSKLGAAVLSVARNHVGLSNWSEQLENLTEYTNEDIQEAVDALTKDDFFQCADCMLWN